MVYLFTVGKLEILTSVEVNKEVNWKDPALERWFGTITRRATQYIYRSAWRAYTLFTKETASALVDEALEDAKRDPREKRDIVLKRLIDFYHWLITDYPVKSRGKGKHEVVRHGVSGNVAHTYVNSVRSFYGTFGVVVRMKGRHALPKPRVKNKRMKVGAEQVRLLIRHARTPRDRAIILTQFQGGMDVSTLCSLKYGDVTEGLAKNEHPLKLDLYRPKTGVEYYTFIGRDAVESIKAYISDAESRGTRFKHDTPLFLKERGDGGITTNLIQNMMRKTAVKSKLVDEKNNGRAFNPLSPHALRESFGSIMINSGVPDTITDFWLGHEIGEMAEAYKSVQYDSLREMYLERERLLSVSAPKVDVEEVERKIRLEVEDKSKQLQVLVNGLSTENYELRQRIGRVEREIIELKKTLESLISQA